jgi:hypothetical protein
LYVISVTVSPDGDGSSSHRIVRVGPGGRAGQDDALAGRDAPDNVAVAVEDFIRVEVPNTGGNSEIEIRARYPSRKDQ